MSLGYSRVAVKPLGNVALASKAFAWVTFCLGAALNGRAPRNCTGTIPAGCTLPCQLGDPRVIEGIADCLPNAIVRGGAANRLAHVEEKEKHDRGTETVGAQIAAPLE